MFFTKANVWAFCAATASAYSPTERTFAVNHFYGTGALVEGRIDPIISPGVAASHVHTIQGGNAFSLSMTDDQPLNSTCTSSRVKNDKSNYWTPKLYFQDPITKLLEPVEMFYMNVYYFFDATTDKIKAFPEGLRIYTGNPSLRSPPATGGEQITDHSGGAIQPAQWTCPRTNEASSLYPKDSDGLHGVGIQDPNNGGSGVGFPDQNCDGYASPLRADIHLPSCYNPAKGVENYEENMDYPTNGNCPEGWTHVPHMFYEVYWNTPKFQDRWTQGQGKQPFVLANGDPTGYGLHADFISGWDPETLQQIIDNCDAGSSGMDKCPGLIGGLNDPSTSCNIDSPVLENITGILDQLPGGISVGTWGGSVAAPVLATVSLIDPSVSAAAAPTQAPATMVEVPVQSTESSPAAASTEPITTPTGKPVVDATAPSSSPATLMTSYVITSSVVWTTVTAPGPSPTSDLADGWSYNGCYADTKERALSGIEFANVGQNEVSNTKCVAYCASKGFSMAVTMSYFIFSSHTYKADT
ncbi:wsc domain containing protein [Diplocarpon rosae]|nr:wsc domain containing protein [Diplocarpon rosae]